MTSLNRQRANIVFSTLLDSDPDIDLTASLSEADTTSSSSSAAVAFSSSNHFKSTQTAAPENTPSPSSTGSWMVLTPKQAAAYERIFEQDGVLRWTSTTTTRSSYKGTFRTQKLGHCRIGASLHFLVARRRGLHRQTATGGQIQLPLSELITLFSSEPYLLLPDYRYRNVHSTGTTASTTSFLHRKLEVNFMVLLKHTPSSPSSPASHSHLKAWMHVLLAARVLQTIVAPCGKPVSSSASASSNTNKPRSQAAAAAAVTQAPREQQHAQYADDALVLDVLQRTLVVLNEGSPSRFHKYLLALQHAGWDTQLAALETQPGRRRIRIG